jgi:hypothetical protein
MDAQEHPGPAVEDQLEQAFLAGDDPARGLAEFAAPDLIRDPPGDAFFLASARAGDFGRLLASLGEAILDLRPAPGRTCRHRVLRERGEDHP